jgi:hypothetical protein
MGKYEMDFSDLSSAPLPRNLMLRKKNFIFFFLRGGGFKVLLSAVPPPPSVSLSLSQFFF